MCRMACAVRSRVSMCISITLAERGSLCSAPAVNAAASSSLNIPMPWSLRTRLRASSSGTSASSGMRATGSWAFGFEKTRLSCNGIARVGSGSFWSGSARTSPGISACISRSTFFSCAFSRSRLPKSSSSSSTATMAETIGAQKSQRSWMAVSCATNAWSILVARCFGSNSGCALRRSAACAGSTECTSLLRPAAIACTFARHSSAASPPGSTGGSSSVLK
mmetsp:Transcript_14265/g.33767  ORF Transcript_14265/g.33767 Transcript_14265/m.33767 type:complete len:221 (-) Transcript_14265:975-1637(-)